MYMPQNLIYNQMVSRKVLVKIIKLKIILSNDLSLYINKKLETKVKLRYV